MRKWSAVEKQLVKMGKYYFWMR